MIALAPPLAFGLSWLFALIGWNAPGTDSGTPMDEEALRWILFIGLGWTAAVGSLAHTAFARGTAESIGKPACADAAAGKATFVSILGLERARDQARLLGEQANAHLEQFGAKADPLRWMTEFVISRKS